MNEHAGFILFFTLLIFIGITFITILFKNRRSLDVKKFNNGKCRKCGGPLQLIDDRSTPLSSNAGYKCQINECDEGYIWITHDVDYFYRNPHLKNRRPRHMYH